MLYINVHRVTQLYGGPEEGGWYYDAGEPLASIPIATKEEKGKGYYVTSQEEGYGRKAKITAIKIHLQECDQCKGTGEYEEESEELDSDGLPRVYAKHCEYCGEIPADLEATEKLMLETYSKFPEESCGRYEHISVSLQDHFAVPFPDRKPHYE